MSVHRRVPIVTPVKGRRQFLWWCNIGAAVQHMTDLVRIFLVHTRQRQLCETFGSASIKRPTGWIHLWAFRMASVFSLKAEQRRCHDNSDKPQRRKMKFEDHGGHNHPTIWLRKDC